MKKSVYDRLISTVAALSVAAGLMLVFAGPAEANLASYRWHYGTICVEDHIHDGRWPGKSAVYRWDKVPDLRFVYRKDCSGYRQEVILRSRYMGSTGYYGKARVWYNDHKHITRATITMNDSYYNRYKMRWWGNRRSAIMHELGHVSGIKHTSYWKSLMNIYNFHKFDYPTWYDKREIERRYPW